MFHHVLAGDNGTTVAAGYPAKPGYDLATGWGSVDGAAFLDAFGGP